MSGVIEFPCPSCQQVIRTNARYQGMQGPCPHCGKTVRVEAPAGQVFEAVAPRRVSHVTTDANTLLAGLIAAGVTVLLYGVFFAVRATYVGQLFLNRGPIPLIATFVTCWGLAILVWKYVAVKRQIGYAELEMDFIPLQKGMQIDSQNVDDFLQHLDGLQRKVRDSILGRRIHGALEHFRARNSVPEVQAYLGSQAEIDASTVDSGYTLVRAFIWAIPILGFIGTVMGISEAVSGLASSLDTTQPAAVAESDPAATPPAGAPATDDGLGNKMIAAMGVVTQGLATAFDTTFLALVMAILLLFPTESLKRVEYGMLDRIESFTNDALLRRLSDQPDKEGPLSPEIANMLEPAFRRHQQWLLEWQNKVSELGNVIGRDFDRHLQRFQEQLTSASAGRVEDAKQTVQAIGEAVEGMSRNLEQFRQVSERASDNLRTSIGAAERLQQQLAQNTEQMAALSQKLNGQPSGGSAHDSDRLAAAADSLNRAAERLSSLAAIGGDGAALEAGEPAGARRGLFGMFRRA